VTLVPILVIDLEATCADDGSIAPEAMETIEVGAVWATPDGTPLDRFQAFVRPLERPQLTPFCTALTGIRQADIDAAPLFPVVAEALRAFASRHHDATRWMSWGAYDRKQIERDCARHGVSNPLQLAHENAKRHFAKHQRIGKEVGMAKACELARIEAYGTSHRGLDDALNISRLLPWVLGERSLRSPPAA